MKKFYVLCVLVAVTMLHTGCFLLSTSTSDSTPSKPTVDYAPQMMRHGSYLSFTRPDGVSIKIVFESHNVSENHECTATNGRINAAYYRYDGFNMASLTYNYQPDGGMSKQYKAELDFTHETGGTIRFPESDQTARFTYRP